MREEISKILVKWSMPTRQAAISELLSLFQSEMEQVIGKDEKTFCSFHDKEEEFNKDKERNNLRAEQRQKLAHLTKKIEEEKNEGNNFYG